MDLSLDLVSVVLQLSKCRSLEQVVQVLAHYTRELTGADGVTVVLKEHDQCFYVEENAIAPLWKGKRFPMSACISGWCMIHRRQVAIRDIYADERIPHDAYRPTFVKSLAMTPIRSADPLGAIGAYWGSLHTTTPEELRILQALGDSAAMALENAQLIEALKENGRRKDAFLSMLAHELRNPLAPIRNGLHLLRLQGAQPDVVEQAAEMMERQVVHLTRIVDDLLDVARIANGKVALKRSGIDLAVLLRRCVDDRRQEIDEAGLSLKLEVPLTPIWIEADGTRVRQIFDNVLENARKYTPRAGTVSVSLRADPQTKVAQVDVRDTGIGIAPELLPTIFEAFVQADTSLDRSSGGLGLGLAIANGLARLHGGGISVRSEGIGQGAHFTITLPGAQVGDPTAPGHAPPGGAKTKARVLIIEDNVDSARSLQKLMRFCGYNTLIAYDGQAGVEMARAQRPEIILCDIGLPKLDGYGVAVALRQASETAQTRMIAVTGYGTDDDRRRASDAGFDAHLVKPIDLQELLQLMRPAPAA